MTSLRQGGTEEPEGPLLGEGTGVAENDRHRRVAHLKGPDQVREEARGHVRDLEESGVAILDDQGCVGHCGEFGKREAHAAVDEGAREVLHRLALDDGEYLAFVLDAVVARRKGTTKGARLLACEPEGVALPRVDGDREVLRSRGASC